ncbi:MAG: DUF4249 domain-containing protein [Bacteroidota bacterium]
MNRIFIFSLILFLASSCETVIDVDLDSTEPALVIEALLQEGTHDFEVKISRTQDYFDAEVIPFESQTEVSLSNNLGESWVIPQEDAGLHQREVSAQSGVLYTLTVRVDGQEYQAVSTLPEQVSIDSLTFEYEDANPFLDEGYEVFINFTDPLEVANFYRVLYDEDGVPQRESEDYQVVDDQLIDGNEVELPLFRKTFPPQTELLIELRSLNEAGYEYYFSLGDIIGAQNGPGGGNAAPGNPVSNWTGDVLGYFIAYSSDTIRTVLPER